MADKPDDGPSLEMPSFSLRRRKGRKAEPETSTETGTGNSTDTPVAPQEAPPEPTPVREPEPVPVPVPVTAPTRATPTPPAPRTTEPEPRPEPDLAAEHEPRAPRSLPTLPTMPALPSLPGVTAAAVTGAVVGVLAVLMTWLATASCDLVRGTSSCGGGPGFLILVAVLVVLAYAGAMLLGAFGVPDAGSTSVLAVGITAVLVMLFLLDAIDGWAVIAVPVVSVVAYLGSWWITQAVVEND